jgi:hypothetical protein
VREIVEHPLQTTLVATEAEETRTLSIAFLRGVETDDELGSELVQASMKTVEKP